MSISRNDSQSATQTAIASVARPRVAVVGARGYAGLELTRLLLRHPEASVRALFATSAFDLADYLPSPAARRLRVERIEGLLPLAQSGELDFVFLATPFDVSVDLAPKLLELGINVIDLSGAFRLKSSGIEASKKAYVDWYGSTHPHPQLIQDAEYGLMPWAAQAAPPSTSAKAAPPSTSAKAAPPSTSAKAAPPSKKAARLVANPGCYATAASLALIAPLKAGLLDISSISIDGKSGTTGAGRKSEERLMHSEVSGTCLAYKPGAHQHEPEIGEAASQFAGCEIDFHFAAHLLECRRGIVVSVYARPAAEFASQDDQSLLAKLSEAFEIAYGSDPLIETGIAKGGSPLLNLRRVAGSARTQISFDVKNGKIYIFCLIDNLLKGAASQAIENYNRLCGLAASTGLTEAEGMT